MFSIGLKQKSHCILFIRKINEKLKCTNLKYVKYFKQSIPIKIPISSMYLWSVNKLHREPWTHSI